MGRALQAELDYRREQLVAAASPRARAAERQRLVAERAAAERVYRARPWDHGAEADYLRADGRLRRHDAGGP